MALRVLIVGCGNIAGGFDHGRHGTDTPFTHAGAYDRHGGFELVACIEPDAVKRTSFMQRWNVPQGFSTTEEVLAAGLLFDVVSICSPTDFHFQHVIAALRMRPRLVFCEKPLTPSVTDSNDLMARCAAAGVLLTVNYTRRWDAFAIKLADDLRDGIWGRLRSVTCLYNKGLLNNGSHMIDLLHMLLGRLEVRHVGQPVYDMLEGDPSIPIVLSGPTGETVQLNCGDASDYSLFELQLVTEKGLVVMEDGGLTWRQRHVIQSPNFKNYRVLDEGDRRPGKLAQATLAAVTQIHDVLLNGGTLSSTGVNALEAQRICETVRCLAPH